MFYIYTSNASPNEQSSIKNTLLRSAHQVPEITTCHIVIWRQNYPSLKWVVSLQEHCSSCIHKPDEHLWVLHATEVPKHEMNSSLSKNGNLKDDYIFSHSPITSQLLHLYYIEGRKRMERQGTAREARALQPGAEMLKGDITKWCKIWSSVETENRICLHATPSV